MAKAISKNCVGAVARLDRSARAVRVLALALIGSLFAATSLRAGTEPVPAGFEGATVVDKPGARVPLGLHFNDEEGRPVRLEKYFDGKRPVLLAMIYIKCPRLCNLTLNGMVKALREIDLEPGKQFEIVTVSFDPREDSELAKAKKAAYIESLGKPEAAGGWHFLTNSDPVPAKTLGDAIGFGFKLDPKGEQYLHQAAIYVCMPDGRVAQTLAGVDFEPGLLTKSLLDAGAGKSSGGIIGFALSCGLMTYDPATGRRIWAAVMVMRLVGIFTVLVLGGVIGTMVYREKKKQQAGCQLSVVSCPRRPDETGLQRPDRMAEGH